MKDRRASFMIEHKQIRNLKLRYTCSELFENTF